MDIYSNKNHRVCRTCLQEINSNSQIFYLDHFESKAEAVTTRQKLKQCIPELNLDVTPNAIICADCLLAVNSAHNFKNKCLQTEERIYNYLRKCHNPPNTIDLMQLIHETLIDNIKTEHFEVVEHEIEPEPFFRGFEKGEMYNVQAKTYSFADIRLERIKKEVDVHNDARVENEHNAMWTETEGFYICNICDHITERKSKLVAHLRTHENEKGDEFVVPKVLVEDVYEDKALNHVEDSKIEPQLQEVQPVININAIDDAEALYMCSECEYITERKSKLDAHTKNHTVVRNVTSFNVLKDPEPNHANADYTPPSVVEDQSEALYMCNNCEYITERKSKLIVHLKTHKDIEPDTKPIIEPSVLHKPMPYRCCLCPYGTRSKVRLDAHMKFHTGEKSYTAYDCYVCNYTTSIKKCLIDHLRIHGEDKPFKCADCDYKTDRTDCMYAHMRRHVGGKYFKTYKCYVCNYKTSMKKLLTDHLKMHGEAKSFKCTKCEYRCNRPDTMEIHLRRHMGVKPFKCSTCNYRCIGKKQLKLHEQRHSDDKPFKCNNCDYCTSQKKDLEKHLKAHPTQNPYKCYVCDFTTVFKRRLLAHLKTHGESKMFKCTNCDYKCDNNATMSVHIKNHSEDKPFKCTLCDYSTVSRSYFRVHMRIHTGEKPYLCKVCGFQTARRSSLKLHVRVHTGERPFKCTICTYRGRSHSSLREHRKTHFGKKSYTCVICGYKCITLKLLQGHMYVHTEARTFKCNDCNLSYKRRGSLLIHMRKHSGRKYACTMCSYSTVSSSHLRRHRKLRGHVQTPIKPDVESN